MWSQEKYQRAAVFAASAHEGQKVPGTNYTYFVHLSNVAMEVIAALCEDSNGIDCNLAVECALLHDTIEDAGIPYETLAAEFGNAVADGVLALTKDIGLEKSKRMEDCLRRILLLPKEIGMVKLADRITNLQKPPAHWTRLKISEYLREAEMIYERLKSCSDYLAIRLKNKIGEYEKYLR